MAMKNDWGDAHCKRVIKRVCKEFGVPPCGLRYSNKRRDYYHPMGQYILLSRKSYWPTKAILAHEISHHIDEIKNRPRPESYVDRFGRRRFKRSNFHGKQFQEILGQVVSVMYDRMSDYPWNMEYSSIRKAWEKGKI